MELINHTEYFRVSCFKAAPNVLEGPKDIWSSPFKIAPTTNNTPPTFLESLAHPDGQCSYIVNMKNTSLDREPDTETFNV